MNYYDFLKNDSVEDKLYEEEFEKERELSHIALSDKYKAVRYFYKATYDGFSAQIEIDKDYYKKYGKDKTEAHLKPILYRKLRKLHMLTEKDKIIYEYYKNNHKITEKALLK